MMPAAATIKPRMAIATYLPHLREPKPGFPTDPMEIAAQLADGLILLDQCRARNVAPSPDLLEYVDFLLEMVEELEFYGHIHSA